MVKLISLVILLFCSVGQAADIGSAVPIPNFDINTSIPFPPDHKPEPPTPSVVVNPPTPQVVYEYRCVNGVCTLVPVNQPTTVIYRQR